MEGLYWFQWYHYQKCHVALHFDIAKTMVSLMIPSEQCDTDTCVNGVTCQKSQVTLNVHCLNLTNGMTHLMIPLVSGYVYTDANCITWPKKSCCTSFSFCWLKECNSAIYDANGVTWPKSHITPHFNHLYLSSGMVLLTMLWYHVMLTPIVSHDQKSHDLPHFDHLDLRNTIVLMTMPPATHDTNASASGITWPKSHVHLILIILTY